MFADHIGSIHVGEGGSSLPKKKTTNELEEPHLNLASQVVSAQSSSGKSMGESSTGTTSFKERKIFLSLILYGLKGFTMSHDLVPYPILNEHVLTSIYSALLINLLILFFTIVIRMLHLLPCLAKLIGLSHYIVRCRQL